MNKIIKKILASKRFANLMAKREALIAKKETARAAKGISLGQYETMAKKIDRQLRRIESVLFRAGKINTLRFDASLV